MQEEYRIIKDFNNYEISNLGNVRNVTTGKMIKHCLSGNYYRVRIGSVQIKRLFQFIVCWDYIL